MPEDVPIMEHPGEVTVERSQVYMIDVHEEKVGGRTEEPQIILQQRQRFCVNCLLLRLGE